jgi:hypothetical protein
MGDTLIISGRTMTVRMPEEMKGPLLWMEVVKVLSAY